MPKSAKSLFLWWRERDLSSRYNFTKHSPTPQQATGNALAIAVQKFLDRLELILYEFIN